MVNKVEKNNVGVKLLTSVVQLAGIILSFYLAVAMRRPLSTEEENTV